MKNEAWAKKNTLLNPGNLGRPNTFFSPLPFLSSFEREERA